MAPFEEAYDGLNGTTLEITARPKRVTVRQKCLATGEWVQVEMDLITAREVAQDLLDAAKYAAWS